MGHVHLQVGDIPTAEAFYVGVLGFETAGIWARPCSSPQADITTTSASTRGTRGAGPRAASLGLGTMDIVVPDAQARDALRSRLASRSVSSADDGRTLRFSDPWGSEIRVTDASS